MEHNKKRNSDSIPQFPRLNPIVGNITQNDKDEVTKKLKTYGLENNSFQWKSNINNLVFPNIFGSIEDSNKQQASLYMLLANNNTNSKENKEAKNMFYLKELPKPNEETKINELISEQSKQVKRNDFKPAIELLDKNSFKKLLSANQPRPQCSDSNHRKQTKYDMYVKQDDEFKTAADTDMEDLRKLSNLYNTIPHKKFNKTKSNKFIPPLLSNETSKQPKEEEDERLKNIDPKIIELIQSEIMDAGAHVEWDDIAGLEFAKTAIKEAVVWPMLRPDIFTGLRRPPKGILLFGPPGTGKTLIGKCVASQSKSTFFSISASSLTSKWVGEAEKMVRALFTIARCHQPAVIFIDEIDSLLSQRSETEHESSRRIKTEFLVQLDGARTESEERLLIIGATNRPQELDEAARRRFVKRLYIPLPENEGRLQLVKKLMGREKHCLNDEDYLDLAKMSDGYSGADIKSLCSDACLGPIRSMDFSEIENVKLSEVRPVSKSDFSNALARVKSSVSPDDLEQYLKWDKTYGSGSAS